MGRPSPGRPCGGARRCASQVRCSSAAAPSASRAAAAPPSAAGMRAAAAAAAAPCPIDTAGLSTLLDASHRRIYCIGVTAYIGFSRRATSPAHVRCTVSHCTPTVLSPHRQCAVAPQCAGVFSAWCCRACQPCSSLAADTGVRTCRAPSAPRGAPEGPVARARGAGAGAGACAGAGAGAGAGAAAGAPASGSASRACARNACHQRLAPSGIPVVVARGTCCCMCALLERGAAQRKWPHAPSASRACTACASVAACADAAASSRMLSSSAAAAPAGSRRTRPASAARRGAAERGDAGSRKRASAASRSSSCSAKPSPPPARRGPW